MSQAGRASEREQTLVTVQQCELQLRRAQEAVRAAGEALRRAIRQEADAGGELGEAERRRDRLILREAGSRNDPASRYHRRSWVGSGALDPPGVP